MRLSQKEGRICSGFLIIFLVLFIIIIYINILIYQNINLLTYSTNDFESKIDEKTKPYTHIAEAFSPILDQKQKLNSDKKSIKRFMFWYITSGAS